MNKTIYRQTNKKWSNLPYPDKNSSFGGNACGACAVLHVINERPKYWNYTPAKVQPYMKQYAVSGCGTLYSGIKDALIHYGMENVKRFTEDVPMNDIFKELDKGNRLGVLLVGGSQGGITWSLSRHYVCFKKYKVKKKKHYFYIVDSGDRHNDGWFCYETQLKGCITEVTTCTRPAEPLEWIWHYAKLYSYAPGTKKSKWNYTSGKPLDGYKTALKKQTGRTKKIDQSDCGWFVATVVRATGIDPEFRPIAGSKSPFPNSKKFKIVHKGSKFPDKKRKRGQIFRYKKTNGTQHTGIIMANGYIAEGGREIRFPRRVKSKKYNGSGVNLNTLEILEVKEA